MIVNSIFIPLSSDFDETHQCFFQIVQSVTINTDWFHLILIFVAAELVLCKTAGMLIHAQFIPHFFPGHVAIMSVPWTHIYFGPLSELVMVHVIGSEV